MARDPMADLALRGKKTALSTSKGDRRAGLIKVEAAEDQAFRERVRDVLKDRLDEGADLDGIAEALLAARQADNRSYGAALDAGRHLLRVWKLAGEGAYRELHRAGLIPYSESMGSKLRAIVSAVDSGKMPKESLPNTVEAAYLASKLPEPSVQLLVQANVIRPDSTVKELLDATKSEVPPDLGPPPQPLAAAERRRLEKRLERLRADLAEVDKRRNKLQAEIRGIERRLAA